MSRFHISYAIVRVKYGIWHTCLGPSKKNSKDLNFRVMFPPGFATLSVESVEAYSICSML
jgi:hypothetical protein